MYTTETPYKNIYFKKRELIKSHILTKMNTHLHHGPETWSQKGSEKHGNICSAFRDFSSWQQSPIKELTLLQACFEQEWCDSGQAFVILQ